MNHVYALHLNCGILPIDRPKLKPHVCISMLLSEVGERQAVVSRYSWEVQIKDRVLPKLDKILEGLKGVTDLDVILASTDQCNQVTEPNDVLHLLEDLLCINVSHVQSGHMIRYVSCFPWSLIELLLRLLTEGKRLFEVSD